MSAYPDPGSNNADLMRFITDNIKNTVRMPAADGVGTEETAIPHHRAKFYMSQAVSSSQFSAVGAYDAELAGEVHRARVTMPETLAKATEIIMDDIQEEIRTAVASKHSESMRPTMGLIGMPAAVSPLIDKVAKTTTEHIYSADNDAAKKISGMFRRREEDV